MKIIPTKGDRCRWRLSLNGINKEKTIVEVIEEVRVNMDGNKEISEVG